MIICQQRCGSLTFDYLLMGKKIFGDVAVIMAGGIFGEEL